MNENNNFYSKLKQESIDQFEKCIEILNNDINAKKSFFQFLFNDIIKIDPDILSNDIEDIINNSNSIINDNLENIYNNIIQNNSIILKEFKQKINIQYNLIVNKIKECDNHLNIIKNIYINEYIENYISISKNNKINLNFDNKKVLIVDNIKTELILGEFFTRFLFNLIILDEYSNFNEEDISINNLFDLTNNFYDPIIINDYINSTKDKIENFNNISINFKYWFILILLIDNIFNKNSNYNTIFNRNMFDKLVNDILTEDKKKEKLKEMKNKIKDKSKLKINNKELTNYKSKFNHLFKNIEYDDKKLEYIYSLPFHNNMVEYFQNEIDKIQSISPQKIDINMKLKNPFNGNDIPLKQLLSINNSSTHNIYFKIKSKMSSLKFDIYESLNLLKDINNKKEIEEFINKIKKKLLLLLYFLYDLKKNIYIEYIQSIINIFGLNANQKISVENKKNLNKKNKISPENNNTKENTKISKGRKNNIIKKYIVQNNNKLTNQLSNNELKIKNLQNKIKMLKNQNNINADIEILKTEKEIKKIYTSIYKSL